MANEESRVGRRRVMETGTPVKRRYEVSKGPLPVNIYTFGNEDDENIPEGESRFILGCSRADYPALRPRLAQALGRFVARLNACNADKSVNPENRKFRELLNGNEGRDAEVFIIPLRRSDDGTLYPEGGVRFMTKRTRNWSDCKGGTLNLVMGRRKPSYDSMHLDVYESGKTGNDLVSVAVDI